MSDTDKNQDTKTEKDTEEAKPLFEVSRRVLLAAIGAAALAQDEIEDFVKKLVDRGEIAEKDGRRLVKEVLERRGKTAHEVEDRANEMLQEALKRVHIPSKKDMDELSEKIAALSQKIDELNKK